MLSFEKSNYQGIQPPPVAWFYHVLIWTVYTLFWHFMQSAEPLDWRALLVSVLYTLANVAVSYWNVFYLMPRYLQRKRIGWYIMLLLLTYVSGSLILLVSVAGLLASYGVADFGVILQNGGVNGSVWGSNLSAIFVTMVIQLVRQRTALQRHQQQLEKLQLTTELNYLKSQLNPHFLFNALNSIYFLIKKDADAAADALAGFSDLLRYQLYQTEGDTIALKTELENVEKYVQLAALRKSEQLSVIINFSERITDQQITPLLLLPLVENAFKHVAKGKSEIRITAYMADENELRFVVSNPFEEDTTVSPVKEAGGIGLKNIQRRLELIYPERHSLRVEDLEGLFTVILKLKL